MRKVMFCVLILSVLCGIRFDADAASVSVGAASWYSDWSFDQQSQGKKPVDSALMYGPLFSVSFADRWSWSNIFLYGKFTLHDPYMKMDLARIDVDSTLNYSVTSLFKVFAGAKWMAYSDTGFFHRGGGPAAGIGVTLPLSNQLFVLGNVSGVYIFGNQKNNYNESNRNSLYREPGVNTTLALAYAAESVPVSLSLGGRFQYFRSMYESGSGEDDITHMFYGVTLSAIYTFK